MEPVSYTIIRSQLEALQDDNYRKFNESLIPGIEGASLGVRLPQLRAMTRQIIRGDWRRFLDESAQDPLYEIVMLRGLVIAAAPCEYQQRLTLLAGFIPSIQNWAVCDSLCSSLKSAKQHPVETFAFLQPYLNSQEGFHLRFGVVMLMDYFIQEAYIDQVLDTLASIHHTGYYGNMAIAWALSVCFVKFRDKTLSLLESGRLSPWVQNKAIQKCRESQRVSSEDKKLLLNYKRQDAGDK